MTVGGVHFHIYRGSAHCTGLRQFLEKLSVKQRARHLQVATRDTNKYFSVFSDDDDDDDDDEEEDDDDNDEDDDDNNNNNNNNNNTTLSLLTAA